MADGLHLAHEGLVAITPPVPRVPELEDLYLPELLRQVHLRDEMPSRRPRCTRRPRHRVELREGHDARVRRVAGALRDESSARKES